MTPIDNILIHIGYHKTGTSWLQDEVFDLESSEFHSLSALAQHFVFDRQGYMLNSFDLNEKTINEELALLLNQKPIQSGKVPVLSYERLSGSPFSAGVNASRHAMRLKNIFPNAKILIVIRNQRDAILSVYFQYLTGGGTHGIKKFLKSKFNGLRPHFAASHYSYHHAIAYYQSLFGKDGVLVLPYELFHKNKFEYFQYLSEFLKKEIDPNTKDLKVYRNKNHHQFVRYQFRFLNHFLRPTELNNFAPLANTVSKKIAWRMFGALKKIPLASLNKKTKQNIENQIEGFIKEKYIESNKETQKLTGIDMSKFGYF